MNKKNLEERIENLEKKHRETALGCKILDCPNCKHRAIFEANNNSDPHNVRTFLLFGIIYTCLTCGKSFQKRGRLEEINTHVS